MYYSLTLKSTNFRFEYNRDSLLEKVTLHFKDFFFQIKSLMGKLKNKIKFCLMLGHSFIFRIRNPLLFSNVFCRLINLNNQRIVDSYIMFLIVMYKRRFCIIGWFLVDFLWRPARVMSGGAALALLGWWLSTLQQKVLLMFQAYILLK